LPAEQAISNEELAILWRSLERIPENYREPLVLFYREHQSIEAVAQNLELTEDAVKQRLSRGRKMLHEQVLAFVEGALERTNPGKTFTLGVVAALPLLTTTAKAATATVTATKGGAMAKATGAGAFLQAIAALSPILLLGGFFGFKMGGDARQSSQQRESVATFWRIVVGSLAAFVVLPFLLLMFLNFLPVDFSGDFRQRVMDGVTIWLGLMYAVVIGGAGAGKQVRHTVIFTQPLDRFGFHLAAAIIDDFGPLVFGQVQDVLIRQATLQQQVEVEILPLLTGHQIADVPAPPLVGPGQRFADRRLGVAGRLIGIEFERNKPDSFYVGRRTATVDPFRIYFAGFDVGYHDY